MRFVQHKKPGLAAFLNELRGGGAWHGSETALVFLQSIWGLTKATYIVEENGQGLEILYLECGRSGGVGFACRSSQRQMRQLYEMDFFYPFKCLINWKNAGARR